MIKTLGKWLPLLGFRGSNDYWKRRYRLGGDSGRGSEGRAADYKATIINDFIRRYGIRDAVEFGCGDGRQLSMIDYPQYLGLDISSDAISACRKRFGDDESKRFAEMADYCDEAADVCLSLDVIYHLVEDEVYDAYLQRLFANSRQYVVIYSTVAKDIVSTLRHVRHRPVDKDVEHGFPDFLRMRDFEASLPPPVEYGRGGPTQFLFYARIAD